MRRPSRPRTPCPGHVNEYKIPARSTPSPTMPFTPAALRFLRGLAKNNNKAWFEAHRTEYESEVREPMRDLIGEMNVRFAKFAPEMVGDPKRSMFRINRDIRFSQDKSPYKTHAACWFHHRRATSMVGAGLWMPPRPQLNRLRDAIANDPGGFKRVARGLKRYGGLDDEAVLTRMPRGFSEDHPAATWLRYQSFTSGRLLKDSEVT